MGLLNLPKDFETSKINEEPKKENNFIRKKSKYINKKNKFDEELNLPKEYESDKVNEQLNIPGRNNSSQGSGLNLPSSNDTTQPASDSNTSESWPEKFKCVTSGQLREDSDGQSYYTLDVDGVQYYFDKKGCATKADPELWDLKYKCENGKYVFYSPCSLEGKIVPGKENDPWEYKKSVDPDDSNVMLYCVKKKTSNTWIFLSPKNPKFKKAYESVKKYFESLGSDSAVEPPKPSGTETPSPTPTPEPPKYPKPAPQEVITQFSSKFPCLDNLKTYVNVDKDGDEYFYKVERITPEEKVFYFLNGICQIKKEDGTKVKKYFHCPGGTPRYK